MSAPQCCICGSPCEPWHPGPDTGYGHNPDPLGTPDGRCCDACNQLLVFPARMKRLAAGLPIRRGD